MSDILTAYYSFSKNTQSLAEEICLLTDSDIVELIPKNKYSFDYNTASKQVRREIEYGFCPELISGNDCIEKYKTIFIGSPNWFKSIAPPVLSFLKKHDFSNKIVIPFCTHGGGGFGDIEHKIKQLCPNSQFLNGIAIDGDIRAEQIINWLNDIGLINSK